MPDYKQYNLEYMSVAYGRFDILQYLTIDCGLGLCARNPCPYTHTDDCDTSNLIDFAIDLDIFKYLYEQLPEDMQKNVRYFTHGPLFSNAWANDSFEVIDFVLHQIPNAFTFIPILSRMLNWFINVPASDTKKIEAIENFLPFLLKSADNALFQVQIFEYIRQSLQRCKVRIVEFLFAFCKDRDPKANQALLKYCLIKGIQIFPIIYEQDKIEDTIKQFIQITGIFNE